VASELPRKTTMIHSIESRILDMQTRKQRLADALYEGAKQSRPFWSEEDMITLFAPLEE